MVNKEEILQFSGLPNFRYPNNIADSDKNIFDSYLNQIIPNMEIKVLNNVLVSPYGTIYKRFSILQECTPFYFDSEHEYVQHLVKNHINAGGIFGGSIERLIRHFIMFKKTNITETCFWCSDQYSPGYFHWLSETLPRIYLLSLLEFKHPKVILPGPTMKNVSFIKQSLTLIFPDIDFSFTTNRNMLELKELIWISRMGNPSQFNAPLMTSFRKFIRGLITVDSDSPKRRLYISRKKASRRKFSNEHEVERLVKRFGFETICFEEYSFEEQIKICSQSEIMVGIHGAGLTNMIFMPEGSFVLELQRCMSWSSCFYNLANTLDLNYYYLFCKENFEDMVSQGQDINFIDLKVDLSSLEKLLDNIVSNYKANKILGTV